MNEPFVIPSEIKVGPYSYRVFRSRMVDADNARAQCDCFSHELRFALALSAQELRVSLLHELLHAIFNAYGLRDYSVEQEERVISSLAPGLAQVLTDMGLWPEKMDLR